MSNTFMIPEIKMILTINVSILINITCKEIPYYIHS